MVVQRPIPLIIISSQPDGRSLIPLADLEHGQENEERG